MLSRRLFCVADPTHADFGWAAESRFLHIRKYDACGNTVSNWTFPVADTEPRGTVVAYELPIEQAEEPVMAAARAEN